MVEGRQEGTQSRKYGLVISKFYVQERELIMAGHAEQPGGEGKRGETQIFVKEAVAREPVTRGLELWT